MGGCPNIVANMDVIVVPDSMDHVIVVPDSTEGVGGKSLKYSNSGRKKSWKIEF